MTAGTLTANDALLNEFEEELQRYAGQRAATGAPAKKARLAAADANVDLAADAFDGLASGYGVGHRPGAEGGGVRTAGTKAEDIAQARPATEL